MGDRDEILSFLISLWHDKLESSNLAVDGRIPPRGPEGNRIPANNFLDSFIFYIIPRYPTYNYAFKKILLATTIIVYPSVNQPMYALWNP